MQVNKLMVRSLAAILILTVTGCEEEESKRLVEMAEKHLERQAEQSRQMSELQRQVAEGANRLVEADAKAREEMVALQRDLQADQAAVGRQRDQLEEERRDLAAKRHVDPIVAAAITNVGLLLACVLPLALCWYLLQPRVQPADDQAVAEVLLQDLVSDRPLLLPRLETNHGIGLETGASRLPDTSEDGGVSG